MHRLSRFRPFYLLLLLYSLLFSLTLSAKAQSAKITMANIQSVNVDEVSDADLANFWNQAKASGIAIGQVETIAASKNMPAAEITKLMARLNKLETVNESSADGATARTSDVAAAGTAQVTATGPATGLPIFGSELFNNKNLTFEPNLKIPTPANYQLGTDDELIIDIYGNSEASYKLKVTPEGTIRIPNVGVLSISGLTVEQATKKIVRQLKEVYSGMNSGQTSASITLGNIKTIKVMLLGEINMPGTYSLPSLATAFNALYVSGGPNRNGSFRNIQVIRNGKIISTIDVYDFLLKGEAKSNIRLQDQDIIKVVPFTTRIELGGQIKRPAIYEVKKGEFLKDIIGYAGGFTDNAYRERIKLIRNTSTQKEVDDIVMSEYASFVPQSGDIYTVDGILDRYANRVQLNGAVFRPGYFALDEGMTLKQLILKADGLREEAFMNRGIIFRLKEDNSLEVISFNLNEIMSGSVDITLKREDNIQIASKFDLKESANVTIFGEVLKPGTFPFADNMKLQDIIIAAGGLKESAFLKRIEVSRRMDSADRKIKATPMAKIISLQVSKDLSNIPELANFVLQPYDIVTVFANPALVPQKSVRIFGHVMFPGEYVISKSDERVSDLVKRAGGLTSDAFPEGAVMLRNVTSFNRSIINRNKRRTLNRIIDNEAQKAEMVAEDNESTTDMVGINLDEIMKNPGSKQDIFLLENDVINIPKQQQTVSISGEVLFPLRVVYTKGESFKDYVMTAGGFSEQALKKKGYVVYPNGEAKATRSFLFIKRRPKIKPGSEIVIPPKEKKVKSTSTGELVAIFSSITMLMLVSISLFKK